MIKIITDSLLADYDATNMLVVATYPFRKTVTYSDLAQAYRCGDDIFIEDGSIVEHFKIENCIVQN
jgi:hypothetical protein